MCKKLREAAQHLVKVWDEEGRLTEIFDAINALRGAVADDKEKAIRRRVEI
jgi:hypothetical protein